jgi:signal transduction histidine kinase/CheY-like chemotaxis protein
VTANADAIRATRYAEMGAVLHRDAGIIIDRWARRAAEEQPHAKRVHAAELLDHLSHLLRELAHHLAQAAGPNDNPHRTTAREHGEQRWQTGWSLTEVIRDYQILRLIILEHLDETLTRPLLLREIQAVGLALDEAIESSVECYVRSRERHLKELEASLLQHTRALEEADRRKNEFLATLGHELRNPLAPLRTCLEYLRLRNNDPEALPEVSLMMERQVHQLTRLVDDLVDVTRIAQGKLTLRREQIDLCMTIEQAIQTNAPAREARQHHLTVSLPETPVRVEADPARLVQVFVNLLNNAVRYTPEGGAIRLQVEPDQQEAVVRVSDNGMGIPPEMLSRIFDLFAQVDPEAGQGGLGVGLTLVRQLVELHQGTITVCSQGRGQGSEFVVRLPLASEPRGAEVPLPDPPAPAQRNILLIEDHRDSRDSLALLLRMLGHQVQTAANGQEGLDTARANSLDVCLVDIGLPDLNGYEVGRQLRELLGTRVLLVALTGHAQPEDRRKAATAGFDVHLTKPVELEALQNLLNRPLSAS